MKNISSHFLNIILTSTPKRRTLFSFLWAIFCIAIFAYFGVKGFFNYESNDDVILALITSGFLGEPSSYTIYNNIIIGYLLSRLSICFPMLNWTVTFYLSHMLLAYIILGILLIYKNGEILGGLLSAIFFTCTCNTLLHKMNYSKSAALIFMVGGVLFVWLIDIICEKKQVRSKVIYIIAFFFGIYLIILGALIRKETLIALLPFGAVLIFKQLMRRKSLMVILPYFITFVVICLLWIVDYVVYHCNNEWTYFENYNEVRTDLMDFYMPEYYSNIDEYSLIGIDECDYRMFKTWSFADDDVFSIDKLNEIKTVAGNRQDNLKDIVIKINKGIVDLFSLYFMIPVAMVLFVILLIFSKPKERYQLILLSGVFLLELCSLIYVDRCKERAVIVPIIGFLTSIFAIGTPNREDIIYKSVDGPVKDNKSKFSSLVLICCMVLMFIVINLVEGLRMVRKNNTYSLERQGDFRTFISEISSDKEHLYIWDCGYSLDEIMKSYAPFEGYDIGYFGNSVWTGAWVYPAPIMYSHNSKFGDTYNIFKLLVNNEKAYLVVDDENENLLEQYTQYINKHYNAEMTCSLVDTRLGYSIYSYYGQ